MLIFDGVHDLFGKLYCDSWDLRVYVFSGYFRVRDLHQHDLMFPLSNRFLPQFSLPRRLLPLLPLSLRILHFNVYLRQLQHPLHPLWLSLPLPPSHLLRADPHHLRPLQHCHFSVSGLCWHHSHHLQCMLTWFIPIFGWSDMFALSPQLRILHLYRLHHLQSWLCLGRICLRLRCSLSKLFGHNRRNLFCMHRPINVPGMRCRVLPQWVRLSSLHGRMSDLC